MLGEMLLKGLSKSHYMTPTKPVKTSLKGITILLIVISMFGLLIFGILELTAKPKTLAESDKVWDTIVSQGYQPEDITQQYHNQDHESKNNLQKCIYFENSDIHFEFFELNSNNMAQKIYSQFHRKIVDNYNASHIIETENKKANYVIYTLDNGERYNVAIYVGHTAVYAYCNSKNKNEINKILDAIDYLEP